MSTETLPPSAPGLSPSTRASVAGWLSWLNQQETVLVLTFIIVFAGVTLVNPGFAQPSNLVDILYNSSYIGVAAIGMTMVILCGHIDISVGAALGICATVAGELAVAHQPMYLVFPVTILTGGVIGLLNGVLIAYGRIPAIVTTLGMASILKGGLILATGGRWIYGLPPDFSISREHVLGIPVPIFGMLALGAHLLDLAQVFFYRPRTLCSRRQWGGCTVVRDFAAGGNHQGILPERTFGGSRLYHLRH